MILAYIVIGIVAWWGSGTAGFIYWWTAEWNLGVDDALFGLFPGLLLGPLTWLVGRGIHGQPRKPRILIKKRVT